MTPVPPFARYRNLNSSIDSICTECFRTIATANSIEELASHEEKHTCDPNWVYSHRRVDSDMGTQSVGHPRDNIQAS